ncbi:MAG TPA: aminotransferase class I/II-fold pyridoxal phosphate-dependent enzyme [Thermomicrobiales bacterium]|nr:aminotransferase class I/II-fold pyridoxal phosphate-dependent enzyme [Thermomicrobiales bacterium]
MTDSPVSRRSTAIANVTPFQRLTAFMRGPYADWAGEPDALDFTFGNPHEPPMAAYVDALRDSLTPRDDQWFAYKWSEPVAQEAAAASLRRWLGVPFAPEDILMTTGGFSAIALALKLVADPGDEVVFNLPPWFAYEGIVVEAGLVPVKVRLDPATFDLDLDAIAAAITPRTRVVIVNTPNNPTGRICPEATLRRLAELLDDASARNGRRIYLLSDEAYNRIVFDGARFQSPIAFYPPTLLAYSYGKTLLAPGQRIGYLALSPDLPERQALREAAFLLEATIGFIYPNALLQHALPRLEALSLDIPDLQRKRDWLVAALTDMGYRVRPPEGTFYLFPESPIADDRAFADLLAESGVLVVPGWVFETPGYFRICLTANDAMIERSLPGFATAMERARTDRSGRR